MEKKWLGLGVLGVIVLCSCLFIAMWDRGAIAYFFPEKREEGVAEQEYQDQGLVAYFPFDGNAKDVSGNEHHGEIYGAQLSRDRFGNPNSAYAFDGVDDYIALPDNLDLIDTDFTFSAWIKPNDYGVQSEVSPACARMVLAYRYRSKKNGSSLNSGAAMFLVEEGGCGGDASLRAKFNDREFRYNGMSPYEYGSLDWYLYTTVREGDTLRIYVNGNEVSRNEVSSDAVFENPSSPHTTIGGFHPRTDDTFRFPFEGQIDDVRIYDYALSVSEIHMLDSKDSKE